MTITLIIIAVLIIWFIWGLNNKNKMANRISSMGGMRVVYAILINEYLAMNGRIISENLGEERFYCTSCSWSGFLITQRSDCTKLR